MKRRFLRSLLVIAVIQFFITRQAAGRVVEEGRAERMWMFYPLSVVMNAAAWTLILTGVGATISALARPFRRAS
jgi:hypothetical protein